VTSGAGSRQNNNSWDVDMSGNRVVPNQRQLDAALKRAAKAAAKVGLRLSGLTVGGISLTFGAPSSALPNGNDQLDRWIEKHADKHEGD
jgi:hypothetical protein